MFFVARISNPSGKNAIPLVTMNEPFSTFTLAKERLKLHGAELDSNGLEFRPMNNSYPCLGTQAARQTIPTPNVSSSFPDDTPPIQAIRDEPSPSAKLDAT